MSREPHIPLFLWIATALLVHLTGGEGAQRAADLIGERLEVQRFADAVRRHVRSSARTVEVALVDEKDEPLPPDDVKPDNTAPDTKTESKEPSPDTVVPRRDKTKPKPVDLKEKEKAKELAKPKEVEKPKVAEEKKKDAPKQDLPVVRVQNRIAVAQNVQDKNQKDNPNAQFIGNEANHVQQQTRARITATDQNDPNPTPGSAEPGPTPDPGNAHVNDVANSEDSPGRADHAPNAHAAGARTASAKEPAASGAAAKVREVTPGSHKGQSTGDARGSQTADAQKLQPEREAMAGATATHEAPDIQTSRDGAEATGRAADERVAQEAHPARPKRLPPMRGESDPLDFLGLGASGTTAGGINLNLTPGAALAAVGHDELGRELVADGERRRSKHRGSWHTVGIERWRAAIENYDSSVKPGNQTALNTARVPFATYLNQIHNRIHPIFADGFLASLDSLPADNPMNRPDMKTNLEIVLDKDEGKIVRMGVTRSSGSTMFDVAALESVQNASPFGKPPSVIVSPDGRVYLHWEFYRNPYYACSTYFAHPYMLKASPESAPSHLPAPVPPAFGPHEQPLPAPGRGDLGTLDPSYLGGPRARPE